jgi:tetratricopeptide (TPR) repeat protein
VANIPGSPNLSRFYIALKVDEETPLPPPLRLPPSDVRFITKDQWSDIIKRPLDDDATKSDAESSNMETRSLKQTQRMSELPELFICRWLLSRIEKPWTPLNEVYPFPTSTRPRKSRNGSYLSVRPVGDSFQLQIIDREARLQKLQKILPADNPGLVNEMAHLAYLYSNTGRYGRAESLYSRVAVARQESFGPCHSYTLGSYLDIIETKIFQGKSHEVVTMHQDLTATIQKLFGPCHLLAIRSKVLLGDILHSVDKKEAEILKREVLQITLSEFGQSDSKTLQAMRKLSRTLTDRGQYSQSEQLLRTSIQATSQAEGTFEDLLYISKRLLGSVLGRQGQFIESCRVLKDALRWSTSTLGMESPRTMDGMYWLAESLRRSRKFEEGELLIRRSLWRNQHVLGATNPNTWMFIHTLAAVMANRGCWSEAADLYEHLLRRWSEHYGPDHRYTYWAREDLGEAYAMQGLYQDPAAFAEKLKGVLESDITIIDVLNVTRKANQVSDAMEEGLEEVEGIRPFKKRRTMTCTHNFKIE